MTTEQMDWLDDERAGRHAPKVLRGHPTEEEIAEARKDAPFGVLIVPEEELGPYFGAERPRIRDVTGYDADTMGLVYAAFEAMGIADYTARDVVNEMQNRGILFRERVTDAEEHTHHTREARDQCAAGDHQYAKLLDDAAEREKIAAHDETEGRPHLAEAIRELIDRPQGQTTMAEEPIENRLRRAYLNGFTDGFNHTNLGKWDR